MMTEEEKRDLEQAVAEARSVARRKGHFREVGNLNPKLYAAAYEAYSKELLALHGLTPEALEQKQEEENSGDERGRNAVTAGIKGALVWVGMMAAGTLQKIRDLLSHNKQLEDIVSRLGITLSAAGVTADRHMSEDSLGELTPASAQEIEQQRGRNNTQGRG